VVARRRNIFAAALGVAILLTGALAPAAVDLSTGIRYVIPTGTLDECNA
jgi:hypothetical protein